MKKNLVSKSIARSLKELGFRDEVASWVNKKFIGTGIPENSNAKWLTTLGYISMPTVDEAIDWLRRKYNVVIYEYMEPFVDPRVDNPNRILYKYAIKWCNLRDGWNGRVYIGESNLLSNIYTAKREAIKIAVSWIRKNKELHPKSQEG